MFTTKKFTTTAFLALVVSLLMYPSSTRAEEDGPANRYGKTKAVLVSASKEAKEVVTDVVCSDEPELCADVAKAGKALKRGGKKLWKALGKVGIPVNVRFGF
jgi:hypothetical protein